MSGLDRSGRDLVRGLMDRGASQDEVKSAISKHAVSKGGSWAPPTYDFGANSGLVREMAGRGYKNAAEHLKSRLDYNK